MAKVASSAEIPPPCNVEVFPLIVTENTALVGGGGVSLGFGESTLVNVTISNNTALDGGGAFLSGDTSTLTDVTISDNTALRGGGIYQENGSSALTNVTISHNTVSDWPLCAGGGVYMYEATSTLKDVTISSNTSSEDGGGIYEILSTTTLIGVTIIGNTASNDGGGMYLNEATSMLTNVTINGNTAIVGGGAYQHQGMSTLTNVVISGNRADQEGGGICLDGGTSTVTNATISGNSAISAGGVLCGSGQNLALFNTIVARNRAWPSASPDVVVADGSAFSGANNLIGDGSGQTLLRNGVHGNLVGTPDYPINPQFVNTSGTDSTKWDLHLQSTSPAINKGSNSLVPKDVRTDLAGNPRIVGRRVDIGAYETQKRAATVSISINGGAAQRSMVKKIVVAFPERVTLDDGAVTVLLANGEAVPDTITDINNLSGDKKKYVITFHSDGVIGRSLADGVYDLVVHGEYVKDMAGNTLDGDYTRRFHRLFGDADGNGTVNAADRHQLQIACSPFGRRLRTIFDFDGNGVLTGRDLREFLQRYGSGV